MCLSRMRVNFIRLPMFTVKRNIDRDVTFLARLEPVTVQYYINYSLLQRQSEED